MSALPPDGAVFLYYEQNQAMMAALLRAFAAGARPGCDGRRPRRHRDPHRVRRARRTARRGYRSRSAAARSARSAPTSHGDADSQMLSYLANGIAVAAEAVEADVPVVVLRHEIVADSGGPGYNRGGASVVRDSLWLEPAAPLADDVAREAGGRVRRQRRRRRQDRAASGCTSLQPTARRRSRRSARTPTRDATPLAGVVDRETNAPDLERPLRLPVRAAGPPDGRAARRCATSITAAAAGATRSEREPERVSATCATATSRSRARRATTVSSWSATPRRTPRACRSTPEATARLRTAVR